MNLEKIIALSLELEKEVWELAEEEGSPEGQEIYWDLIYKLNNLLEWLND